MILHHSNCGLLLQILHARGIECVCKAANVLDRADLGDSHLAHNMLVGGRGRLHSRVGPLLFISGRVEVRQVLVRGRSHLMLEGMCRTILEVMLATVAHIGILKRNLVYWQG